MSTKSLMLDLLIALLWVPAGLALGLFDRVNGGQIAPSYLLAAGAIAALLYGSRRRQSGWHAVAHEGLRVLACWSAAALGLVLTGMVIPR